MRRLLFVMAAAALLLATSAAPVLGARPIKEEGTILFAGAFAQECEQVGPNTVCTEFNLFVDDFGETFVCVDRLTYSVSEDGRFRLISYESGCASAEGNLVVNENTLEATLSPTEVQLFRCTGRRCVPSETVTVSATFEPVGELRTGTVRGSFTSDGCKIRFVDEITGTDAEVTITVRDSSGTETITAMGFVERIETTFTAINCE